MIRRDCRPVPLTEHAATAPDAPPFDPQSLVGPGWTMLVAARTYLWRYRQSEVTTASFLNWTDSADLDRAAQELVRSIGAQPDDPAHPKTATDTVLTAFLEGVHQGFGDPTPLEAPWSR